MRIQGFDIRKEKTKDAKGEEWVLSTKRTIRIISFCIGCVFFPISIWVASTEGNITFLIYIAIGILLIGGAILCDEIRISKNQIQYKKAFPFRTRKNYSFDSLVSIHHGPVNLAIGLTQAKGYRVWFEFSNDLPLSVIYEKMLKMNPSAPLEAEGIALEISESLNIPLVKSKF